MGESTVRCDASGFTIGVSFRDRFEQVERRETLEVSYFPASFFPWDTYIAGHKRLERTVDGTAWRNVSETNTTISNIAYSNPDYEYPVYIHTRQRGKNWQTTTLSIQENPERAALSQEGVLHPVLRRYRYDVSASGNTPNQCIEDHVARITQILFETTGDGKTMIDEPTPSYRREDWGTGCEPPRSNSLCL